jgi:hypothetical protein
MATRIAVVGTINYDKVVSEGGSRFESFGGITYNIVALAELSRGLEICPIAWVGEDRRDQLWEVLAHYPEVRGEGISVSPSKTNENLLTYASPDQRDETLAVSVPPIGFEQIEPFLSSDLFLVNFISGFDLPLDTLRQLRDSFQGTVFIDIHSLTLGIDEEGRRFPKHVQDWEKWVACGDVIQANHSEAEVLTGTELEDDEDLRKTALAIMDLGPSVVLFTLGRRGCLVVNGKGAERRSSLIPAPEVEIRDTTGAGDVFSAAFIVRYLETGDPVQSARFATHAAGKSCERKGLEGLRAMDRTTA